MCPVDSDGDGMTNGQELGDPDCKWVENQMPERTTHITNPGKLAVKIHLYMTSPLALTLRFFLKWVENNNSEILTNSRQQKIC